MRSYLVPVLISLPVAATGILSWTTTFGAEPRVASAALRLGDENLLGPITYGDTAKFWETHTLVVGTIRESRQEYLPEGKPISREYVGIRLEETIPDRRVGEQSVLRILRHRLVVVYDIPANPPPPLYRVGDRIMLLVANGMVEDPEKESFELRSYAMMPNGNAEVLFIEGVDERLIDVTKRLCQILATDNPTRRVAKIREMLKERNSPRVTLVLHRSLQTTSKELEAGLQDAKQLLHKFD